MFPSIALDAEPPHPTVDCVAVPESAILIRAPRSSLGLAGVIDRIVKGANH